MQQSDNVNRPKHYLTEDGIEAIQVIKAFKLSYVRGNAIKYILRAARKGKEAEDIKKAIWYLQYDLRNLELLENRASSE